MISLKKCHDSGVRENSEVVIIYPDGFLAWCGGFFFRVQVVPDDPHRGKKGCVAQQLSGAGSATQDLFENLKSSIWSSKSFVEKSSAKNLRKVLDICWFPQLPQPIPGSQRPAPAPLLVLHMFSFRPHGAQFNAIKIGHKGHIARPEGDNLDTGKLKQKQPWRKK